MRLYDTHADIMHNLYERTSRGEKDVFERYHLHNLREGHIKGGIWVVYSESDFDLKNAYNIAFREFEPYKNEFDVIYGLEGLRNVLDVNDLDWFYQRGIRHASLTWNEENHFATGVAGDKEHGLKEEGKKIIEYMNKQGMIIDVSHLNVKSFFDVAECSPKILMASHSNAWTLTNHRRNLNDEQLKVIKELGGYVGVNSARNFVSSDKTKQTIDGLIDHMIYLGEHIGINHVMLGLDMMDFLDEFPNANLDDLVTHKDAINIASKMEQRGFSQKEINMICNGNYLEIIKKVKR